MARNCRPWQRANDHSFLGINFVNQYHAASAYVSLSNAKCFKKANLRQSNHVYCLGYLENRQI